MMSTKKYFAIITDVGQSKIAEAVAGGQKLNITTFLVGDGNGEYYVPTSDMTAIKNEVWRGTISKADVVQDAQKILRITTVIPAEVSGFIVREIALLDETGELVAIGNTPDLPKVRLEDGASTELKLTMRLAVKNTEALSFTIDPHTVIMTKDMLDTHNVDDNAHNELFEGKYDKTGGTISGNVVIQGNVAEGNGLTANISNSRSAHAEGEYTTTFGRYVHAEGGGCVASSDGSHVEGAQTIAGGLVLKIKSIDAENKTITFDDTITSFSIIFNAIVINAKLHIINTYYINDATRVTVESVDTTNHSIVVKETIPSSNFNPSYAVVLVSYNSVRCTHAEGYRTIASGDCTHAEGTNTKATEFASHAEGFSTEANGRASHAEGEDTVADGSYSHAEGGVTKALSNYSHAEGGNNTTASDMFAHAEGQYTTASGNSSHSEGLSTKASGGRAHAEGHETKASGEAAHAEGYYTTASGNYSHAGGYYTTANNLQTVIGKYNTSYTGGSETGTSGSAFIIGNGTSNSARSNCFRVQYNGVTYSKGSYNTSGADYAEYFEWLDGNTKKEDRTGLFVTLDGEKIRIATPDDDYILGIVSACPSIVGNAQDDQWGNMYEKDVFGREITEEIDVPDKVIEMPDPENSERTITQVICEAHKEIVPKLNIEYDNTQKYIPRSERPEWDTIGMLGKLVTVDDGSCEVNGWCKVGKGGVATKSEKRTQFRVISRLDKNHIRVLIL